MNLRSEDDADVVPNNVAPNICTRCGSPCSGNGILVGQLKLCRQCGVFSRYQEEHPKGLSANWGILILIAFIIMLLIFGNM
jgi:hypothetical protein